jgi:lysophospholipase L1-like esterase
MRWAWLVVLVGCDFWGWWDLRHYRNAWGVDAGPSVQDAYAQGDPLDKYRGGQDFSVVVMGNSVAVGYVATNWAAIQEEANDRMEGLQAVNPNATMTNLSGNGWCTEDHLGRDHAGNGRTDTINLIAALPTKPDVVLLPLQINDRNHDLGLVVFRANTIRIIERLRALDIVPVIIGEFGYQGGFEDYNAEALEIANEYQVAAINAYPRMQTAYLLDTSAAGIMADYAHPNPAGHDLMAQIVLGWFNAPMMRARP